MVKTPNVRHSKSRKDPVTIDLEASRLPAEGAETARAGAAGPDVEDALSAASVEGSDALASDRRDDGDAILGTGPSGGTHPDHLTASNEALLSEEASDRLAAAAAEQPELGDDAGRDATKAGESPGFGRGAQDDLPRAAGPATPPPARRGGVSAVAAGLIGGVIALAGAGALQYAGVLPSPAGGGDAAAVESLRADMARLQSEIAAAQAAGGGGASEDVGALQTRTEQLAADIASLRQAVEAGGAGESAGVAALDTRIAEIETRIAKLGEAAAGAGVDLGPVNDRIAAIEAQLQSGTEAAASVDARVAKVEQTLAGVSQSVADLARKMEAQADQPKIALSIAASALKAAIDRGQPFAAELETLAAISPNLPQLGPLRAHAEAGVASREDLAAQIDEAANAMIAADSPADENAGYLDQLWNSAASLVTVRPVGSIEGAGVPETVARMEAALKAGNLGKALAEYETLPENAKAAGKDFAARVKARLDVETLADQAIAEAMKTV